MLVSLDVAVCRLLSSTECAPSSIGASIPNASGYFFRLVYLGIAHEIVILLRVDVGAAMIMVSTVAPSRKSTPCLLKYVLMPSNFTSQGNFRSAVASRIENCSRLMPTNPH
jgi:hypothetical protein